MYNGKPSQLHFNWYQYKSPITIFSNKNDLNNNNYNKYERNIYQLIYDDYKGKA